MFLNVFGTFVWFGATFSGPVMKTQFLLESELRQKQALKLYTVWLMPTEEAMRSPWDMSTCISRGIKENMQRKSHWKDKCVGTLWRTQKWKPPLGNNIRFYSPWTCSEFSLILSFTVSPWHYPVSGEVAGSESFEVYKFYIKLLENASDRWKCTVDKNDLYILMMTFISLPYFVWKYCLPFI